MIEIGKLNTKSCLLEVQGNLLTVHNIRDFKHQADSFTENYITETYDLEKIKNVWFIVSHFSETNEGLAHTFLSFEFEDDKFLAISIEARREKNESYSPLKGILKQYEMLYVVGTEEDLLKLRTEIRDEKVYLYPANTTPEKSRKLLLSFMDRMNQIHDKPEFYNTILNNCTNQIIKHIETFSDKDFPFFSWNIFMPGYSDEVAYEMELIPHDLPLEEIQKKYRVDREVKEIKIGDNHNYSVEIRK